MPGSGCHGVHSPCSHSSGTCVPLVTWLLEKRSKQQTEGSWDRLSRVIAGRPQNHRACQESFVQFSAWSAAALPYDSPCGDSSPCCWSTLVGMQHPQQSLCSTALTLALNKKRTLTRTSCSPAVELSRSRQLLDLPRGTGRLPCHHHISIPGPEDSSHHMGL